MSIIGKYLGVAPVIAYTYECHQGTNDEEMDDTSDIIEDLKVSKQGLYTSESIAIDCHACRLLILHRHYLR